MFESAAIVQYLCDRHPEAALAPLPKEPERPHYLQWLFFMADTIYPSYNRYYWSGRYTSTENGAEGVRQQAAQTVLRQWQVVEDSLQRNGPWLLGARFSACDIYLQMMTTWHETPRDLFAGFPKLKDLALGVIKRESCRRALERHNFDTGLNGK
jgi:glutathione S-transferase